MEALEFRFAFHARDFARSIHFPREVLGLRPVGGLWDRLDGKGALFAAGGTAVIEIYGAATGKTYDGPRPEALNLALRVPDAAALDESYGKLRVLGVQEIEPPQVRVWGHRSSIFPRPGWHPHPSLLRVVSKPVSIWPVRRMLAPVGTRERFS